MIIADWRLGKITMSIESAMMAVVMWRNLSKVSQTMHQFGFPVCSFPNHWKIMSHMNTSHVSSCFIISQPLVQAHLLFLSTFALPINSSSTHHGDGKRTSDQLCAAAQFGWGSFPKSDSSERSAPFFLTVAYHSKLYICTYIYIYHIHIYIYIYIYPKKKQHSNLSPWSVIDLLVYLALSWFIPMVW